MMEMERIFNQRLDEAKEELVSQNKEHKDRERMIRLEIKEAREEG